MIKLWNLSFLTFQTIRIVQSLFKNATLNIDNNSNINLSGTYQRHAPPVTERGLSVVAQLADKVYGTWR